MTHNRKPTVHLLHGFVATGKTTFARELEKSLPAVRFSPDEWMSDLFGSNPPAESFLECYSRVVSLMEKMWLQAVHAGTDVVLDFGFWKRADRDAIRAKLVKLNINWKLYSIICAEDVALTRCRKRNENLNGSLVIDDNAFTLLRTRFEALRSDEASTVISSEAEKTR